MAKVYDVPAQALIGRAAKYLQEGGIAQPEWTSFVKTGVHADRPPQDKDWWYTRCASILRKIYLKGPIGISDLRKEYGGGRPRGYGAAHHRDAGGAIIRNAVHGLESMGLVASIAKKGRVVTPEGMKKLDNISTDILKEMIQDTPALRVYR